MKYYTIGEFGKLIRKSVPTLRDWDKKGILKPHHLSAGNHRVYSDEQLYQVLNMVHSKNDKLIIGYCRVSNSKRTDMLEKQIECVKNYMACRGYRFEVISDTGSGVDYRKHGFTVLVDKILCNQVEKLVLLRKDVLVLIGFEIIESLCRRHGVEIEIIDNTPENEEQELLNEIINLSALFIRKARSKKSIKEKEILSELLKSNRKIQNANVDNANEALPL